MATLTVTDLAAVPTGATAAVSGSAGGANTVYVQRVDGTAIGGGNWALGGTRTGDGAVSLSLAKGYYFAYCQTGTTAASPPVYFAVTDGLDAVATRCRRAIKATVQLVDLPCTANVYERWDERDRFGPRYPCVVLSTEGLQETELPYTQGLDDVGRPTQVLICDGGTGPFDTRRQDTYESWRQALMRPFRRLRLAGVPEVKWCEVEPGRILAESALKGLVVVSSFVIRTRTREPRGLGA